MTQQASYIFTEEGKTFAVVFEGDAVIAAVEAADPTPENLIPYIEAAALDHGDPFLVETINHQLSFGGAAEMEHIGTVSV